MCLIDHALVDVVHLPQVVLEIYLLSRAPAANVAVVPGRPGGLGLVHQGEVASGVVVVAQHLAAGQALPTTVGEAYHTVVARGRAGWKAGKRERKRLSLDKCLLMHGTIGHDESMLMSQVQYFTSSLFPPPPSSTLSQ